MFTDVYDGEILKQFLQPDGVPFLIFEYSKQFCITSEC